MCRRLKVNYYPTLTIFRYGHPTSFNGERTVDGTIQELEKSTIYNGVVLNTQQEIDNFAKNNQYHAIGYFSNENTNGKKKKNYALIKFFFYDTIIIVEKKITKKITTFIFFSQYKSKKNKIINSFQNIHGCFSKKKFE